MIFRAFMRVLSAAIMFGLGYASHDVIYSAFDTVSDVSFNVSRSDGILLPREAFKIQNTGPMPVMVKSVIVNSTESCGIQTSRLLPTLLSVGDTIYATPACTAVRVSILTDHGSASYQFDQ